MFAAKKYTINVYTGDVSGAGTDANVFMALFGDKGDSGERKLHKSDTYKDKFERGHVSGYCTRQRKRHFGSSFIVAIRVFGKYLHYV